MHRMVRQTRVNGNDELQCLFRNTFDTALVDSTGLIDMEEVAAIARLPNLLPPWQIVRERRATFAATPAENAKRPGAQTAWSNLFLAGDWTQTGLPATIEGAIRSGNRAADLVSDRGM